MEQLIAFHDNPKLKAARIRRVVAHRKADQIIKGQYWEDGKGCAIGCTYHSNDHFLAESELGIPVRLAYLEDRIFEGLPNDLALTWPERFLKAIKPGANLSLVADKMQLWVLIEHQKMLKEEHRPALDGIIGLFERRAAGELPTQAECAAVATKLRADLADLADLADRAYRAYRADLADLADLADRANRAYRANRADLADLADLAYRADRADLADLADLYTKQSEKLLQLLAEAE